VQEPRHIENIALIGFMGTGKTFVGHALAHLLHFQMVDTDDLIEKQAHQRISDIFRQHGEPRFRQYEREIVQQLRTRQRLIWRNGILSTAGPICSSIPNSAPSGPL
jgi:shikimate kinase